MGLWIRLRLVRLFHSYLKQVESCKVANDSYLFSELRRCCHILDKGLNTIPFEKGHGIKIYKQARELLAQCENSTVIDKNDNAFLWCKKTIKTYEEAQQEGISKIISSEVIKYTEQDIRFFNTFFNTRISCRNFTKEAINDETWQHIVNLSQTCPNSCCRQTTRVYIIKDQTKIKKIIPLLGGATGFGNGIPYLVAFSSTISSYATMDSLLPYEDSSIFAGTFVLAARAHNIFCTILNYQHAYLQHNKVINTLLGIPRDETITLFCACGKADKIPAKPARINPNAIIKFI